MFPVNSRQFSATFLDIQRNSRGYNDEVNSIDRDATKRLLRPFLIPQIELSAIPQWHHLGNTMWTFARNFATGECESPARGAHERSCSSVLPEFAPHCAPSGRKTPELNEQQNLQDTEPLGLIETRNLNTTSIINGSDHYYNNVLSEDGSQNGGFLQESSCEEAHICNEVFVASKLSKTGEIFDLDGNKKSSECEHHVLSVNFDSESKLSPTCNVPSELENKAGGGGGGVGHDRDRESFQGNVVSNGARWINAAKILNLKESTAASSSTLSGIKEGDYAKGQHLCDNVIIGKGKFMEELLKKKLHIKPLPMCKHRDYSKKPISNILTMNLSLDTLMSVLHAEKRGAKNSENNDMDICGKIAILHGFQDTMVSVVESEVVGIYNYVTGTLHGLQGYCHDESESQEMKYPLSSSAVSLDQFLAHFQHILRISSHTADNGNVSKEHSPVAWLLTSPALGATLDWQVQEKVLKFIQTLSVDEFAEEQDSNISNKEFLLTQWYNLLVVVDEYHYCEKNIPLVEVFEFCTSGGINVVNFDLN